MSVDSYIVCKDCKKYRYLDRFYVTVEAAEIETRQQAIDLCDEMKREGNLFRSTLVIAFLSLHANHNCTLITEHSELAEQLQFGEYDIDPDLHPITEDFDFWRE
jgi:hypothetical protein